MINWFEELNKRYASGVAVGFILHLNIADYAGGTTLRKFLNTALTKGGKACVAYYNRADGITFELPSDEAHFKQIINFQPDPIAGDALPKSPAQALPLLDTFLKQKDTAVILDNAETLVPDADIAMQIPEDRTNLVLIREWATDQTIMQNGNMVILITNNLSDIHASIRASSSRYESIRISYPDAEARQTFIESLGKRTWTFQKEVDDRTMARATAGLSLMHIEDIYLRAEQTGKLDWQLITERKGDVMRSEFADVLEMLEPRYGYEAVGGLDNVKEFFKRNVIEPMKSGNYGRVPMGVLMTGAAGTGKTIMAEAVAKESGINMAILNPAKIFNKFVGQSERNLEKALEAIKSLAPTLVFMDEIDQQLRRGESGDSGVSNRIFKRLMEFMSDTGNRGRITFLAATNRPDLLDAALKRAGRFDAKIPFFAPDELNREAIFKVMVKKYDLPMDKSSQSAVKFWARDTDGWTGAEIERLVIKAKGIYQDKGLNAAYAMKDALKYIRAKTQDIERMTYLAVKEADDLEFIPEQYRTEEYLKQGAIKFEGGYKNGIN